jgi:hypothetical protein
MSDKRPRVMVDLDPDIEAMLDEEIQRARTDHFLELSRAAAAKGLLRRLRATMCPADPGAPTPPAARASRGRKASALAVAAIGAATLFGDGAAQANSSAYTFVRAPSAYSVDLMRSRKTARGLPLAA